MQSSPGSLFLKIHKDLTTAYIYIILSYCKSEYMRNGKDFTTQTALDAIIQVGYTIFRYIVWAPLIQGRDGIFIALVNTYHLKLCNGKNLQIFPMK